MVLKQKSNSLARLSVKSFVFAVAATFLPVTCGEVEAQEIEVIPVEAAFDNQGELKVSDCFKKIRYVALETTDDCLIGKSPLARVLGDYIVVTSQIDMNKSVCHLFDKRTGRFVRSVGSIGKGPGECRSLIGGWMNPYTGQLYFSGWKKDWQVYRSDGGFDHTWRPSVKPGDFMIFAAYDYWDAETNVGYYSEDDKSPARFIAFKGDKPVCERRLPLGKGDKNVTMNDIAGISVMRGGACGIIILKRKDGKSTLIPSENINFWHAGKELHFKQPFNDTIYRVSPQMELLPTRLLDFGKYKWTFDERFEDKKDAIYPASFLEGKDMVLFRFLTNVFDNEKRQTYTAIYRKNDGTVKVAPFNDKIKDDRNGFLPLQPLWVSEEGVYTGVLQADEVAAWFEKNSAKAGIPAEVAALKEVGEEDNPVVVFME